MRQGVHLGAPVMAICIDCYEETSAQYSYMGIGPRCKKCHELAKERDPDREARLARIRKEATDMKMVVKK